MSALLTPVLGALTLVALGVMSPVYAFGEKLLYFPQPLIGSGPETRIPGVAAVELAARDGIKLRGWLATPATPGPHPLIVYFGGNAEEVSHMMYATDRFAGFAVLAMNYRGYGTSEGEPSEAALTADALAIFDFAVAQANIDSRRIVAMGRSLGSGVAVALAAQRPIASVILVTPYDSILEVARTHYPFLPVSLLLRDRYESVARAPRIVAPLLMLTAGRDTIIPRPRSDALFAAWKGAKIRVDMADADHNSIDAYPAYWAAIGEFLSRKN